MTPDPDPPAGGPTHIGDWTVLERLGSGGAANVFRCVRDDQVAAVKLLRTGLREGASDGSAEQLRRRLTREAQILTRLAHPGVVRIHAVHLEADPAWIVMDYLEGRHAGHAIRAGPTAPDQVRHIGLQLLSAMEHWHTAGIAHRDIKPGNVIIDDTGTAVVVDFGLALDDSGEPLSAVGVRVGTWTYAPPEWISPERSDPQRWDLYGAGQLLGELLLGRRWFQPREGLLAIMSKKATLPCLDPGPSAPDDLRELVRRLTALDPELRPASAGEAARALHA